MIFLAAELTNAARVLRQCKMLATQYDVVMAGFGSPPTLPGVEYRELPAGVLGSVGRRVEASMRMLLRQGGLYGSAYFLDSRVREWRKTLRHALPVDAVLVNDLSGLPLAESVANGAPIVFDAHEHWTSESASWTARQRWSMRRAHEWIVDRYVPQTAAMMTVSPGIVRDYYDRAGIRAALVTNAPYFRALSPSPVDNPIRLVHIGLADPRRRLEDTIEAVRLLDGRFALDLILAGDNEYRRRLEYLVATEPHIAVLPPVPTAQLIGIANEYDVGVALFPPHTQNLLRTLPNKLFDYIQARLVVAIGPSPEMVNVVHEWDCGVVSPTFAPEQFAATLATLNIKEVQRLKHNSNRAAGVLTADRNRDTVISLVEQAIAAGRGADADPSLRLS